MFTGIVARLCRVAQLEPTSAGLRLHLERDALAASAGDSSEEAWNDLELGESIAVNGTCLTLTGFEGELTFDVIPETLRRTNLGSLEVGSLVNLERALRVGERLSGHYVQGHVDTTGVVIERRDHDGETVIRIEIAEPEKMRTVPKGSVTVDGVSLTVVDPTENQFSIALIPHTLAVTTFRERKLGDPVNLEMDHFGKWVEALLSRR